MRILLADDQKEIRQLTQQHLENNGHRVIAVANGEEALRALQQEPFDVILLDEEMPGMTGTQVLQAVRAADNQTSRSIVIALTGYNTDQDRERLLRAGFDVVIGKPFRLDLLEKALRDAATREGARSPDTASVADPQALNDPLARMGGDEQLLRQVSRTFLRALPSRLEEIENSIRQKQGDLLASHAHALKGTLDIFAASHAAALCSKLQKLGQNDSFAEAGQTFTSLKEAIAEVEPNLRAYAGQNRTTAPEAHQHKPSKTKRRLPGSKRKKP